MLKAMAKEPADRYRTAARAGRGPAAVPGRPADPGAAAQPARSGAKWARRRPGIAASAVAMLVLAVVGLAVSNALIRREMQRTDEKAEAAAPA